MPSFVIDEIHVGDIVQGDVVLRDLSFDERMPEPPREMICPTDMPMCPDGTMSRGRGPNCEPICDSPVDVIAPTPDVADFSDLLERGSDPSFVYPPDYGKSEVLKNLERLQEYTDRGLPIPPNLFPTFSREPTGG